MWHVLVTQAGVVSLCNWYRPGASPNEVIIYFRDKFIEHASDSLACVVAGDLNFHSKDWLRFSNANTPEADIMREICEEYSLREWVKQPTRGDCFLELCLSDCEHVACKLGAPIAAH